MALQKTKVRQYGRTLTVLLSEQELNDFSIEELVYSWGEYYKSRMNQTAPGHCYVSPNLPLEEGGTPVVLAGKEKIDVSVDDHQADDRLVFQP